MPENREQLHHAVDRLPAEQVGEALRYLNYLAADPVLLSLLNAPADDESYTDDEQRSDAEGAAAIANGQGISHDEILREFDHRSR